MTMIARAIAHHASQSPSGIALTDDTATFDWAELDGAVQTRAAAYRRDLAPGRAVAVEMGQSIEQCIVDLALLMADLPALHLPGFFTQQQRDHALAAAGAQALIRDAETGDGSTVEPLGNTPVALPDVTAKITFTSGSTGAPKGICLSTTHLESVAAAVVAHVGADHAGRHLPLLPPGILLETVAGFYPILLAGGTYLPFAASALGLASPFKPDPGAMLSAISRTRATSLILVPELLRVLVEAMEACHARLPALTLVAVGGARLAPSLIARATDLGLPLRQGYGLTECGSVVALEDGSETVRGTVGRSIGVNRISLADDGEVLIDGPLYLGTPGETRQPGPLRTGDLGTIDDHGRLTITGRKSNVIVTGHGRNVSPEWIESELCAQPGVLQAMAHDDDAGAIGALLVTAPGTDAAAAVAAANSSLPEYAQIGTWREVPPFLPSAGLLTGNGRLRRDAIAHRYLRGADAMGFFDRLVSETASDAAAMLHVPQLRAGLAGAIDRDAYVAYLTQAYHHVRHTVPLMQEARARLGHRPLLVAALDDYIAEETGHEEWILDDIAAAGGNRAQAAASAPDPATKAMVDHAYQTIRHGNAAGFFGMVYVLESTSVALASHGADAVRSALGLPPEAFTYLTSHGALDQDHMTFFAGLMNRIDDPADQAAIVAMASKMYRLFGGVFASIPLAGPAPVRETADA